MSVIDQLKALPDISFIDNETLENVLVKLKTNYESKYEEITEDKLELSDADPDKLKLDSIGQILFQIMLYVDFVGKQNLIKYSTGAFLDVLSANLHVLRKPGKAATVTIRFHLSVAQESIYTIPEGTRCATEDDIFFQSLGNVEIPIGETYADVACICTTLGEEGNNYSPGQINTLVDLLPYIQSVCNVTASSGGEDEESDEDLAERFFYAPSALNGWGGEPYYAWYLREFSADIGDIVTSSPKPCYTDIAFILKDGSIPDENIIINAQKYLDEKCRRELGDIITVKQPDMQEFKIELEYFINESNRKNASKIRQDIELAIENYRVWQTEKFGRDINPAQLFYNVMKAGAKRLNIIEPEFQVVEEFKIPCCVTTKVIYGGIEND